MSDIGLHSNWYERVRSMAELIDLTLIELRSNTASSVASNSLRHLLTASVPSATGSRQVLAMVLQDANCDINPERLGDLLSGSGTTDVIRELEKVAEILERERASTVEQMRK